MAEIISGKECSAKVRSQIAEEVAEFERERGYVPGLTVIIVGENPASQVYVRNKKKACIDVGMNSEVIELPESTTETELLTYIEKLNNDKSVHGILVQLPLPSHINEESVINAISPEKDVDAFHPVNVGKVMTGNFSFVPCTPAGVMEMLKFKNIEIAGKHCVIIGRSNIVGKPQAMLMLKENATVTVCHSRTKDLENITRQADILVAAVGKANFVRADMVGEGAVVVDVGINRLSDGSLCGDVDFASVEPIASYITPVPGGVGPMTITMLLKNTLTAAVDQAKK